MGSSFPYSTMGSPFPYSTMGSSFPYSTMGSLFPYSTMGSSTVPSWEAREENVATFRGSEYFCYDLSQNPIQSSSDEITLSFKTWQRNGLILHTGKSADYVNLALKDGAVSLVINLGSGAFEAIVEPVNGKFNDNSWHDVKVTRNLRQVKRGRTGSAVLRAQAKLNPAIYPKTSLC
ncbi:neurexin-3-like [Alosa pseudoharengus]|uniref:neurexin-3-like n=1 Tax=Alosa pseudoharengus TaxID=34774 RepID=UPI003F8A3D71